MTLALTKYELNKRKRTLKAGVVQWRAAEIVLQCEIHASITQHFSNLLQHREQLCLLLL